MKLKEFYDETQGNYEEIIGRIVKEERVIKYLRKFTASDPVQLIRDALDSKDYEAAFREAHNLKGVCLNLGLDKLQAAGSDLTESLRHGPTGEVEGFFETVKKEYIFVAGLIEQIEE